MHHHDDLGSKCTYTCLYASPFKYDHPQVCPPQHSSDMAYESDQKTGLSLGMEADIIRAGHILSTTSDWSRDISGRKWLPHILNLNHHDGAFAL